MGEETSHRARRRYDDHHYDDYPRQSHSRSHHHHHHHGHRCNQYPEPVHGAEEMFVDGDGSVVTVIRQPSCMPRRHSTQVHQYVSDQPRFPPPRSHTYSEAIPDASHYYATQKALPYGNGDLEDVATTAAMKAVEAMAHQQALQQQEAMEHIHHAQVRPLGRQNTIGSRRRESGHDLWANKGYPTRTGADRSGRRGSLWG
ncbi:hypothetical protein CC78DRAFT_536585 [Lojkania enalia]|uniref:Uncharacterized protein n=1 Tax=Lojkania enalia TaxID=147567 RepID=A0A9P4K059_9PLEO|nr:hypothetical protein CC78DRAFT_536585 [Didymosphaeria enalia]